MARPLRVHIPGGFYHATLRGNHRQPVFATEQDRSLLDELVAEVMGRHQAQLHAYCWMTNHLHLLVRVADTPLATIMHQLASRHARAVQARIRTTGHLFEKRYDARLVGMDPYLLAVVRYIHRNPVEAKLVADPADYAWSSHRDYLGQLRRPWLTTSFVLDMLGARPDVASAAYRALMSCADPEAPFASSPAAPLHFRDHLPAMETATGHHRVDLEAAPRSNGAESQPHASGLEELLQACSARFGLAPALLTSTSKREGLARARAWIAHEAVSRRLASVSGVARFLNRCESSIRELIRRYPREDASPQIPESANPRPGTAYSSPFRAA